MSPPELENKDVEQFFLSADFSATRLVARVKHDADKKAEDEVESGSALLENDGRQDVGGLRTKGYFKVGSPEKPLITIVTVVFNGQESLEEIILMCNTSKL